MTQRYDTVHPQAPTFFGTDIVVAPVSSAARDAASLQFSHGVAFRPEEIAIGLCQSVLTTSRVALKQCPLRCEAGPFFLI